MARPKLLDLFCKAGGCSVGYHRAGFDVVGVDHEPQPRYPFRFVRADALDYLLGHGRDFDVVHASPPCQRYSTATFAQVGAPSNHPDLVPAVRAALQVLDRPYVIENVFGAPLRFSCMLCGLMFGLKVFRHRLFESSHLLFAPEHPSHKGERIGRGGFCCVAGNGDASYRYRKKHGPPRSGGPSVPTDHRSVAAWKRAMGIDWMTQKELAQAIPPAYTEFIGKQLLRVCEAGGGI